MPTTTFTVSVAHALKLGTAFKTKFAAEYAEALAANPALTDEQFVKAVTRRFWEQTVREVEVAAASDAARVSAEAQVQAAVETAIANSTIAVT